MKIGNPFLPKALALSLPILGAAGAMAMYSTTAMAQASPCGPTTTVQPGDTYYAISQRCDVPVATIDAANPGVDPYALQVGQTLNLTAEARPPSRDPAPQPGQTYTVRPGDTLESIATAFGVTVEALVEANPQLEDGPLDIGAMLSPFLPQPEPILESYSGLLTDEGVECQAMRGTDGELYTLIGEIQDYESGDLVQVEGEIAEFSICQQGTTIDVENIRPLAR